MFELEFFEKKCLIIPLKTVYTDHQVDNALAMVNKNTNLFKVQDQDFINKNFSLFENSMFEFLES